MGGTSGQRLRRARERAGLTQREVADRAGISQPHLSSIERGVIEPRPSTVAAIEAALLVRPSRLLAQHRDQVLAAAARNGASNLRVIGSIAHGDDTPGSDVDLLVSMEPGASLIELSALVIDLESILGVHVDVIEDDPRLDSVLGRAVREEAVAL